MVLLVAGYEVLDAIQRIITLLISDSTMQSMFPNNTVLAYHQEAPREPADIYIVLTMPSERDVTGLGGTKIMALPTFYLETIGKETTYGVLRPIAERADLLLTQPGTSALINSTWVGKFIRTNTIIRPPDTIANIRWWSIGGVYENANNTAVFS
jgi:hypothetical protein